MIGTDRQDFVEYRAPALTPIPTANTVKSFAHEPMEVEESESTTMLTKHVNCMKIIRQTLLVKFTEYGKFY